MRYLVLTVAFIALLALCLVGPTSAFAQAAKPAVAPLTSDLDRPISSFGADDAEDDNGGFKPEGQTIPEPEFEPEPPEQPPTFFGEPIEGSKIVMILDHSCSMSISYSGITVYSQSGSIIPSANRWQAIQSEVSQAISDFTEEVEFDMVYFASYITTCFNALRPATDATKAQAIGNLFAKQYTGCTNWYDALKKGFTNYGNDLDMLVFHSDGMPNTAISLGYSPCSWSSITRTRPIQDTPGWVAMQTKAGFKFLVVQQGGSPMQSMIDLANAGGGTFVMR